MTAGARLLPFVFAAALAALTLAADAEAAPFPLKRCVNFGNALEAPHEGEWGYAVRWEDVWRVKQAGFDSFRLPVRFAGHALKEPPYTIDPALLARVDEIIGWADAADLAVTIDLHHYQALYAHPDDEHDRFVAIWRQLAERYRDHGPNLVFEVLNEPQGEIWEPETLVALQADALAEIRKTNPDRWVVVSPPRYGTIKGLETAWTPPADPFVMSSISFYEPMNFTHQYAHFINAGRFGRRWGRHEDKDVVHGLVSQAAQWSRANGAALFVGEFGVYEGNTESERAEWMRTAREAFEAEGLTGWCAWDFAGAFKIYDTSHETWFKRLKAALLE